MRARTLALACVLDAACGDPVWLPHPVRAFGFAARHGERLALRLAAGEAAREIAYGALATAAIVASTYASAFLLLRRVRGANAEAAEALECALAWTTLAARDLLAEAASVERPLGAGDLAAARERVARIVGRDAGALDASGVARAAIETLAESTCDGIAAPLLALACGGAPLALAFKAANTLDSVIGHREPPHAYAGRLAARLDDVLCFAPARLSALALSLAAPAGGGSIRRAFAIRRRDGTKHASPNAGHSEAAIAGALGVRLGGPSTYGGVAHEAPPLGAEFPPPLPADVARARRIVAAAALLLVAVALVIARARERP